VQKILGGVLSTVPDQVAGDVAKLQRHAFFTQSALQHNKTGQLWGQYISFFI
jgi:hypothetical protein